MRCGAADCLTPLLFAPLSIDYSLFLLSRFKEEIMNGSPMQRAVTTMIGSAGHTITVSGCTITVCFLGQLFFPLDILRSLGIGSAVAVSTTLIVNLTLTPAVLLAFPRFFTAFVEMHHVKQCMRCRCRLPKPRVQGLEPEPPRGAARRSSVSEAAAAAPLLKSTSEAMHSQGSFHLPVHAAVPVPGMPSQASSSKQASDDGDTQVAHKTAEWQAENEAVRKSWWLRPARALHTWCGVVVVVLVLAAAVPCWMQLPDLIQTADPIEYTPRDTEANAAYNELLRHFSPGNVYPYTILLVANRTTPTVLSNDFFALSQDILTRFAQAMPHVTKDDFQSIVWLNGGPVVYPFLKFAEDPSSPLYDTADGRLLRYLKAQTVGIDNRAISVELSMGMDPYGPSGQAWLAQARSVVQRLAAETTVSIYLARGAVDSIDSIALVCGGGDGGGVWCWRGCCC